jgi:uncharacterized protein
MRSLLLFGLAALSAATCQRVEEPSPAPPAPATPAPVPTPALTPAAAPSQADRCVVPLAEPAPAVAKPATSCPADPVANPPVLRVGKVSFPEAENAPSVEVEIADTPPTEQRGLMYRTELAAEKGMIFVWPSNRSRTFWMRNTCLPLDMMFIAKDGTVAGILEQVPVMNDAPRSVACPVAYVLEVNAGWSRKHGVKPGMKAALSL